MTLLNIVIWVFLVIFSHSAASGIYKWIDETGEIHYSDVPFENESAYEVNVDTRGTSIGNKKSRKRELDAVERINANNRKAKYRIKVFSNGDGDERGYKSNYACENAKKRLDSLEKIMRKGYSSSRSNDLRSQKRRLSEKERLACRS